MLGNTRAVRPFTTSLDYPTSFRLISYVKSVTAVVMRTKLPLNRQPCRVWYIKTRGRFTSIKRCGGSWLYLAEGAIEGGVIVLEGAVLYILSCEFIAICGAKVMRKQVRVQTLGAHTMGTQLPILLY